MHRLEILRSTLLSLRWSSSDSFGMSLISVRLYAPST
uniref:Uncharacterized protein n=1 Tax=Arundo donax TaxID=35708 RepID=A0A0A9GSW3_ARUDO